MLYSKTHVTVRAVDHHNLVTDNKIGFVLGFVVGLYKLLDIYLLTDSYMMVLVKVAFTALVGGFAGLAGKQLWNLVYSFVKKKYFKNKNKQ